MPDLHARLTAAVNARLEVARAAGGERWYAAYYAAMDEWRVRDKATQEPRADLSDTDQVEHCAQHIADHDPVTVIQHCKRDLRVLERHQPGNFVGCMVCRDAHMRNGFCVEIRDLATAYGMGEEE